MPISIGDLNLPLRGAPGWDVAVRNAFGVMVDAVDEAVDVISGAVDANDATILAAATTAGTGTNGFLYDTFERRVWIDANLNGVVADGVTDDSAAWNAIVAAAPAGSVITWSGTSVLAAKIVWKTGVSLRGKGWGRSVLATVHPTAYFPAISWVPGDGAGLANPLEDCTFSDFEIDGSGLAGTTYTINAKGIFAQWLRRCQFLNLYIHDTIATGLGTDFMPECLIDGVVAVNCGRLHFLDAGGGAGIGIGTGSWEDESVTIVNCHAVNCGNWGIFVEYQETEAYRGRGPRVSNCTATGCRFGFGDRGTAGTVFSACVAYSNELDGFNVSFGARAGLIDSCVAYLNGRDGIGFNNDSRNPYTVRGSKCYQNTNRGIHATVTTSAWSGLTLDSNECWLNGLHGISTTTSSGGSFSRLAITRNRVYNNGQTSASRGVLLDGTAAGFTIDGNIIYDDQGTKTQTVGVKFSDSGAATLTDGTVDRNVIDATTKVSLGAAVRTNVAFRGNVGYVTENVGTGTIADTTSSIAVSHGLQTTPTSIQLGKRSSEDLWVSARTSTTFTVTRAGTSGANTFDWTATYKP